MLVRTATTLSYANVALFSCFVCFLCNIVSFSLHLEIFKVATHRGGGLTISDLFYLRIHTHTYSLSRSLSLNRNGSSNGPELARVLRWNPARRWRAATGDLHRFPLIPTFPTYIMVL